MVLLISVTKAPRTPLLSCFKTTPNSKSEIISPVSQVKVSTILITIRSKFICLNLAGFSINIDNDKLD